jgi:2-hydroxymuconate-semialdehyde hydrolase
MTGPGASRRLVHNGFSTGFLDIGPREGVPLLLIHGSGPGVSAAANWQKLMSSPVADRRRILAPDVVGFGGSRSSELTLTHATRVSQLIDFLDAEGVEQVDVVGNSMGGALALALAHRLPGRVRAMILMGSVGVPFDLTPGLAKVWGYRPSIEAMRELMNLFAYDSSLISDELVRLRYETIAQPETRALYEAAFTEPLQQHIEQMALSDEELASITIPTLLIHGAEDQVVPLQTSLKLVHLLAKADLVVFGACGHWTQIERSEDFARCVDEFFEGVASQAQASPTAAVT